MSKKNWAERIRKDARVVRIVMITIAAYYNGYYYFVEQPREQAAELTKSAADVTSRVRNDRSYFEGFAAAVELQSTSGQPLAPQLLEQGEKLADANEEWLKKAEANYTSIQDEARREKLLLDPAILLFADTTVKQVNAAVGAFREQIASAPITASVQALRQHLQEEEAGVSRAVATLAELNGEQIQEKWEEICRRRGCVIHILEEVQDRTNTLADKTRLCEQRKQAYRRVFEELRKRADNLKHRLEGIRWRDQVAKNDPGAST